MTCFSVFKDRLFGARYAISSLKNQTPLYLNQLTKSIMHLKTLAVNWYFGKIDVTVKLVRFKFISITFSF